MQLTAPNVRALIKRVLSVALLILALVMTVRTDWAIPEVLLDSDASANLILGEKLAREGGIISDSFRYGTELFVVDVQIVYSLLFRICGDWSLVRFWSSVIHQLLMLGAYGLLARQSRMSLNMFCVTGAALLLPFSVPYGRIVIFHGYYIAVVTLTFLMIGLYLGVRRRAEEKQRWWKLLLWGGCMCVTGFLAGMAGIRQMLICAAPAGVSAVLCAAWSEKKENGLRVQLPSLCWVGALVLSITLGYLLNSHVLSEIYSFESYDSQTLFLAEPDKREAVLEGFLASVGFENNIQLFDLHGMLSVAGVAAVLIALVLSVMTFLRTQDPDARFLAGFFLSTVAVTTLVLCFLGNTFFFYELYYLPVVLWMIPALGKADARRAEAEPLGWNLKSLLGLESPALSVRQGTALLACALLIAHGFFYTAFFRNPAESGGEIHYGGLTVESTDTITALRPIADYVREEGYTLIYASYWNGGVIMELTDGQARSVSLVASGRRKPLRYYAWMADESLYDVAWAAEQKACLLLDPEELGPSREEILEAVEGLEEKASIGGYTIYELTDPAAIARMLE